MLQKPDTAPTGSPSDLRSQRRQCVIVPEDVARAVDGGRGGRPFFMGANG